MMDVVAAPSAASEYIFGFGAFLVGTVIGSFLNVCAYRIPREESIVTPRSHCPSCGEPIPLRLNLPLLGWLLLRGKAACCGARIPFRYFLVEGLTGAAFAYAYWLFGFGPHPEQAFAAALFAALLLGAAFTDLESFIIPDRFSSGGALLGLLLAASFPATILGLDDGFLSSHLDALYYSLLGLLVGSGTLYWISLLAEWILRRDALGEGDVKLLGCIGAFCGWQGALFAIFGGALVGTLVILPLMLIQSLRSGGEEPLRDEQAEDAVSALGWGVEIPFGPFLATAALLYLFGLSEYVDAWFDNLRYTLSRLP